MAEYSSKQRKNTEKDKNSVVLPNTLTFDYCSCNETLEAKVSWINLDDPEFEINPEEFNKSGWHRKWGYNICPSCFIPEDWE